MEGQGPPGPLVVRIHGCKSEADLGLALGTSMGVQPAGSAGRLRAQLALIGDATVILQGAPSGDDWLAVMQAISPVVRWTRESPRSVSLGAEDTLSVAEDTLLAWFPAGLPCPPPPHGVQTAPDRWAVVCAGPPQSSPTDAARWASELFLPALGIADGRAPPAVVPWPDLLALETIARLTDDPSLCARALSAAVRLRVRVGQPAAAQSLLRDVPIDSDTPEDLVRLELARAAVALYLGHYSTWRRWTDAAAARLDDAHADRRGALELERGRALLVWWRRPRAAAASFARAQLHWRDAGQPGGIAHALNGEARANLARGHTDEARVRWVQACQECPPALRDPGLHHALRQTEAALQIADNDAALAISERRFDAAVPAELAGAHALTQATALLRTGRLEDARTAAHRALLAWRSCAHPPGVAATQRLLGDIAASQGCAPAADAWFRAALATDAAIHQRAGLHDTVRHALAALGGGRSDGWSEIAALLEARRDETTAHSPHDT